MSPESTHRTSNAWPPRTWGFVVGLFAASLATLIGVLSGLEPETILQRALIGGGLTGVLARCTAALATSTDSHWEQERAEP